MYRQLVLRVDDPTLAGENPYWGWTTVKAEEIDVVPASRTNDRADWKETIFERIVDMNYFSTRMVEDGEGLARYDVLLHIQQTPESGIREAD
jgi:hypothetical protein